MSASAYDLLALLLVIAAIVRLYPAYRSTATRHWSTSPTPAR